MAVELAFDFGADILRVPLDEAGWPLIPPTQLTIHRTADEDEGSRQIICALDGNRFCQVLYGETRTREILPGPHTLRVHNTLMWKTLRFDAPPGRHIHFTVWNRSCFGYYTWLLLVGAAPLWLGVAAGSPTGTKHLHPEPSLAPAAKTKSQNLF